MKHAHLPLSLPLTIIVEGFGSLIRTGMNPLQSVPRLDGCSSYRIRASGEVLEAEGSSTSPSPQNLRKGEEKLGAHLLGE